jgi:hypothetical protein
MTARGRKVPALGPPERWMVSKDYAALLWIMDLGLPLYTYPYSMRSTLLATLLFTGTLHAQHEIDLTIENQAPLLHHPSSPQSVSERDLSAECVPQSEGRFWSIADGAIQEWTLSGGIITGGSLVLQGPSDMNSLAFCSASGPTSFYCDATGTGIQYYDNSSWSQVPFPAAVYNHGGSGQHLYFVDLANDLYHFDGAASTIASPDGGSFSSDIVVDAEGNAIVSYGPSSFNLPAISFRKYSPTGELLTSYATSFIPVNGWGAFMIGNTIYIAFGSSNPVFPEQLVPFTLSGGNAIQGNPIPFPQAGKFDLASCTEQGTIGINDLFASAPLLRVWPEADALRVLRADGRAIGSLVIQDLAGRLVREEMVPTSSTIINTSGWPAGVYLVRAMSGTDASVQRFVKE